MNKLMNAGLLIVVALLLSASAFAQSPVGQWRTIDDETGEPKSIVEIYQENDKLFGKIVRILPEGSSSICDECEGEYAGRELVGAVILRDLEQNGDEWSGGKITDPKNGKTYNVKMSLRDANTLDVRGFIKVPLMGSALGRTQTWYRVTG